MYCDQCGQFWEVCTCEDEPHLHSDLEEASEPLVIDEPIKEKEEQVEVVGINE